MTSKMAQLVADYEEQRKKKLRNFYEKL